MPAHPRGRSRCRAACPRFTGADSIETRREVSDHSEEEESRQQEEGEKDEEGEEIGSLLSYWLARGDTVTPLPFSVLPGSAWVKVQSSTEEVDGGLEVLLVSVAAGPSLDGHDLAVQAFGHAVGDRVSAVGQDVLEAVPEHVGHLAHGRQAAVGGPPEPVLKEAPGPAGAAIRPQAPQALLDGPGPADLEAQGLERLEGRTPPLGHVLLSCTARGTWSPSDSH